MQKSISTLPFTGTPEQEQQLLEVIKQHKDEKGALMPIMQKAQDIYGYLPVEVQQIIAGVSYTHLDVYKRQTIYSGRMCCRRYNRNFDYYRTR